jgi:hypothetical protein
MMKHISIRRIPAAAAAVAAAAIVLHVVLCHPAATSRGYPAIHPFWVGVAPYLAYLALLVTPFFDDRAQTRRRMRYWFVSLACVVNGLVATNVTSARPHTGAHLGMVGEATMPLGRIGDGATDTLMLVEMADSGIAWTEPRDLKADALLAAAEASSELPLRTKHFGGRYKGGYAAFADAHVRWIEATIAPDVLKALITPNGGETLPDEW